MPDGFYLSSDDVAVLRELIEWRKRTKEETKRLPIEPLPQYPEVHLALTPAGGVPALSEGPDAGTAFGAGDVPGVASCTIYKLTKPTSSAASAVLVAGKTKTVYNMLDLAIAGSTWILIARDKYGSWFIAEILGAAACSTGT